MKPAPVSSATLRVTLQARRALRSRPECVRPATTYSAVFYHVLIGVPSALAVSVFAAVDQGLADRIADAIGVPRVQPLKVKLAEEAVRFRSSVIV